MENSDEKNSDCELVSENEVVSRKKQKEKKVEKPSNEPPTVSDSQTSRLKKKRSIYWDYFSRCDDAVDKAECNYCHKRIGCASKSGTTPLRNHINTCKQYPPNIDKKQKLLDLESKTRVSDDGSIENLTFYQNSLPRKEKDFKVPSSTTTSTSSIPWSENQSTMDIEEIMSKRFEMAMGSLKDLASEQPIIIIDETIDDTFESV
ncbi:hypothetical protein E3N88_40165 [Mikania micrantha]|uniref:BED-type domain-containing protein n=1 Tax=Mikania micrantha TaxID=192012 RepID=A0A5N6LP51_9ASTR|nr:hypothetical protein E3N88_40165 [Mikania micrantha]